MVLQTVRGAALTALVALATALAAVPTFAQIAPVTGRVLDAQTDDPIPGVTLLADGTALGTATDLDGRFRLALPEAGTLTASFIGYQTETRSVRPGDEVTFRLRPATTDLQPVVVAASRSAQARAETPVAIASVSAADLQATKPNLLAEALNRAPGVFMVDLGNEQHAMAIRQPFSFKPLFLYLEDGVPIRPSGLFNHNALIEVNQAGVERIEVIRGPGSALYGAGAIGGAVNFVTPSATSAPRVGASFRAGGYGYGRADLQAASTIGDVGVYASGYGARQRDGFREHSDYDKLSLTARADAPLSALFGGESTKLTATATFNQLDTDTDGSLDSTNFFGSGLTSLQTFTNREVTAGRAALRVDQVWRATQRTAVTAFGRTNSVAQNPHYRIRQSSSDPTSATGEVNDNSFNSLGLMAQHEVQRGPVRLLVGGLGDWSPASYIAEFTEITRNAETGQFTGFTRTDSLLTDYDVTLGNLAAYGQLEVEPIQRLRLVAGLRYDRVTYDLDNALPPGSFSGAEDRSDTFARLTPRLGVIYAFTPERGLYANVSQGFLPPEAGELYRGVQVPELRPAVFNSAEVGAFGRLWDGRLAFDVALYRMDGEDEIVTVRLADGSRVDRNAGQTRHEGVEYAVTFQPDPVWSLRLGGTNARHEYIDFLVDEREGRVTRYDGNRMDRAPGFIANAELAARVPFAPGLRLAAEVQRVSGYWMDPSNETRYDGHTVLNLRARYAGRALRGMEVWASLLNATDELYATNASVSFGRQRYSPGLPRALTLGVGYRIGR
ncbi:MAG: TonB-dependent receptor [Bacteroidota bacterium]